MEFQVTILGSNSAIPAHGRNQTSQLLTVGSSYLLLDCGEGTQIQLRKFKLKFSRIDFIFISHLHGDHYYGLMGLISSFHLVKREKLLTIFGPPGLDEIITVQLRHSETKLGFPLRFVPLSDKGFHLVLEEPGFRVFSFPLQHRIACTGFLVEEKHGLRNMVKEKVEQHRPPVEAINLLRMGQDVLDESGNIVYAASEFTHAPRPNRRYAYCSDTKYDPNLVEYIAGADMLYHEATFGEDEAERASSTFHSTAKQAGMIAKAAGVKSLMLGHYSSRYRDLTPIWEEAAKVFPATFLSEEGITYTID
ncbi:Ribonuclease Z [Mariniradius saccharolyticus AK6]|uniref:Ribonuclease Z n=1 Tax=Mariniradius saccharolyticus AK6 TaxID=1239962 RepID=M7X3Y3_9BACT|nr:ribonuclease Z [Mariniradius saccharolyticus]EMS32195.1 Ribonuclease Z [Mariniradius saccharolyticus AK6]